MNMLMKLLMGVIVSAAVLYAVSPVASVVISIGMVVGLGLWIRQTGVSIFMEPGTPGKTLLLWITRSKKIIPLKVSDKAEGYLSLPKWGVVRVTAESDHWMMGKKTMIGVEGVGHTVMPSDAVVAEMLAKHGVESIANPEGEGE